MFDFCDFFLVNIRVFNFVTKIIYNYKNNNILLTKKTKLLFFFSLENNPKNVLFLPLCTGAQFTRVLHFFVLRAELQVR